MYIAVFQVDDRGKPLPLTGWYFRTLRRADEFAKKMNVTYDYEAFVTLVLIPGD